jgi:hypothetical protein
MRKFDDVLRIISSILLGVLIRDIDDLRAALGGFIRARSPMESQYSDHLTLTMSIVLVATFLRNIHGSVRYDELIARRNYTPTLERHTIGRMWFFVLGVAALFLGPFFAGHQLAHHLAPADPLSWPTFCLFFSFGIYILWNISLWLSDPDDAAVSNSPAVDVIVERWLKIDAVGILVIGVMFSYSLYLRASGRPLSAPLMALTFIIFGMVVTLGDYVANREFYFPQRPADETANGSIDEEQLPI